MVTAGAVMVCRDVTVCPGAVMVCGGAVMVIPETVVVVGGSVTVCGGSVTRLVAVVVVVVTDWAAGIWRIAPPHAPRGSMTLAKRLTPALSEYRPPPRRMVDPAVAVMGPRASRLPLKAVAAPSTAEPPTWKKTLQGRAPLRKTIEAEPVAVKSVPTWMTKTPGPLKVRTPVRVAVVGKL